MRYVYNVILSPFPTKIKDNSIKENKHENVYTQSVSNMHEFKQTTAEKSTDKLRPTNLRTQNNKKKNETIVNSRKSVDEECWRAVR